MNFLQSLINMLIGPTIFVVLTAAVFLYLHVSLRKEEIHKYTLDWTAGWIVLVFWSGAKFILQGSEPVEGVETRLLFMIVDLLLATGYVFFIAGAHNFVYGDVSRVARGCILGGLIAVPLLYSFTSGLQPVRILGGDYRVDLLMRAVILGTLSFWIAAVFLLAMRSMKTFGLLVLGLAFAFRGFHHIFLGMNYLTEPLGTVYDTQIVAFVTMLTALMMIVATLDRTRNALTQSESKFRQFFKGASDAILMIDPTTSQIADANPAAEALYGCDRDRLLTLGFVDLSAQEGRPKNDLMKRLVAASKPLDRVETIQRDSDGEEFPVSITRSFIELNQRRFLLLHVRNISELHQQERMLASRISQLTAIQRISQALTRTLDPAELTTIIYERLHAMVTMNFFAIDHLDRETGSLVNLLTHSSHTGVMTRMEPQPPGAGLREEDYMICITEREARFVNPSGLDPVSGPVAGCEQVLVLPMVASDQVVGLMYIGSESSEDIDANQVDLLQNIASISGIALRNAQLYRDQRDQIRRQQFLAELGPAVSAILQPEEMARIVGERLRSFFRVEEVEIWLVDEQSHQLTRAWPYLGGVTPLPITSGPNSPRQLDIMTAAFNSGNVITENNCSESKLIPERWRRDRGICSCVAAPITAGERNHGVIRVDDCRETERFQPADTDFLLLVSQFIASALESARLYQTARASERRFAHLVEAARVGIIILKEGKIEFANAYFQEMLDLLNTPLQSVPFLERVPAEYNETWRKAIDDAQDGRESTLETLLQRADGRRLLCAVSISPVVYMNSGAVQVVVSDITDRRAAQSQRQHDMRIRSIGTLTAGIGRDFHSLLSLMLAQVSYLKLEGMPTETAGRSLGIVEVSTWRALDYTRQLLAFAETSASGLTSLDINNILLQSGQLFDSLEKEEFGKVTFELGSALPRIRGQEEQLRQAFLNLFISLARMAGVDNVVTVQTSSITIETTEEAFTEELEFGDYVIVNFSDTQDVFDSQSLVEMMNLTTDAAQRPTLGMSVFLSTLRGHQVTIDVEKEERGTQLLLYFPAEGGLATPSLASGNRSVEAEAVETSGPEPASTDAVQKL